MSSLLWSPSPATVKSANISLYMQWLRETYNLNHQDYQSLWQWTTDHKDDFWISLLKYFNVQYDGSAESATNGMAMPDTRWFEGIRLSYAEHIFRNKTSLAPAIIFTNEAGAREETSWETLEHSVASVQYHLKALGVKTGDRVVAFMPAIAETTVAFLAANSLGAIWSSCSPDFGTPAVVERFAQIEPKVLFCVDQYQYGGKNIDTSLIVEQLIASLPTLEAVIIVSLKNVTDNDRIRILKWNDIIDRVGVSLDFVRVPFNQPIWVLYSSGTTGTPKAIVHGTGGILLEQLKYGTFHNDFKSGERCTWYTTTGWMMWNYIHGCLLAGCTLVLFDGSPAYPDLLTLWKLVAKERIQHFGTSASFILTNLKKSIKPSASFDFSALRSISSTGSTLPPEGFEWVYNEVKSDVWLASMSGGTDVCSAFVGGNPISPVYAGEIQCRALGCKLLAYDEHGQSFNESVGEMVITEPMPSMPLYFWNDEGKKRFNESYFETFPGVWRHGDWIKITDHDGVIIYGRSDATLNRGGIRIGTSEVYRAVDTVADIKDSLIICVEQSDGTFWMPLFVVMKEGKFYNEDVRTEINTKLKSQYSPRHVPDEIIVVPDIPYTISGKKSEMPVKKIIMGVDPAAAVNKDVLRNPESLDAFITIASKRR